MVPTKKLPSQKILKSILDYDPNTGFFFWKKNGKRAGYSYNDSYVRIRIDRIGYAAHRLAWVYVYGDEPSKYVDHINQIKIDNRIVNLRLATPSQNLQNRQKQKNNTTGYLGVCYAKKSKKFTASIKVDGKLKHLGYFHTADEAAKVAIDARKKFYSHYIQ